MLVLHYAFPNKMLTIGYFLVHGGNIYDGFEDYSYIRDKLRREDLKDLLSTLEKMLINSNGSHKQHLADAEREPKAI